VRRTRGPELAPEEAAFATPCLRALGETGDLNGLVADYARRARTLESPTHALALAQARLIVFAFVGDEASVRRLLGGPLARMPESARSLWLATVEIAAGRGAEARARLEKEREGADPVLRAAIDRRLSTALGSPAELTPESLARLEALRREWDQEVRFTTQPPLPRRAFAGTVALLFLNLAAFGLEILAGGAEDEAALTSLGALVPGKALGGEWWRALAATFLHFGPVHLGINMLALVALGRAIEGTLGTARFLACYLAAGLGSMLACAVGYAAVGQEDCVVVGASGAIMGLVGAAAAIALRGWRQERARVAGQRLAWVVAVIGLQSAVDLSIKEVSFTGHISGVLIGFLVVSFVRHRGTERS
jgi:rhomboid protease GluP